MSIPYWLYLSALLLQLAALVFFVAYATRPLRIFSFTGTLLLGASSALQLVFVGALAWRDQAVPLGNAFEALAFWGLLLSLAATTLETRFKMGILGAFLVPPTAFILLMGVRFYNTVPLTEAPYGGAFLFFHVGLPMAAYAMFTAAAGLASAFLVQNKQLKSGHPSGLMYELPSLGELERLLTAWLAWGFAALSLGLLSGALRGMMPSDGMVRPAPDAKVIFGVGLWAYYAAVLWLRQAGWRGPRLAKLALWGFAVFILGFYTVNIYLGGHAR